MKKIKKQPVIKSFLHAFNGMYYFFLFERNGQIEISVTACTIAFALWIGVSVNEWITILFCIAIVLAFEMMNSALEKLCNVVQEDYHPVIKIIKDMAAAAVLWCSIISVLIAAIIFLPKIFIQL